jgi:hypothetical protein
MIYQDNLISIMDSCLTLKSYYFPFLSDKKIDLNTIEKIEVRKATLRSGKYRIWGSGDFRTWYPFDSKRGIRDIIFIIYLHNKWRKIGFTVEDSKKVLDILKTTTTIVLPD